MVATGDAPGRISLEIAEHCLGDVTRAAPPLAELRGAGFAVAIDAFGTEAASLAVLADLEVDTLKLDPRLVARSATPRGRTVLAAVLRLARELGVATVASGVDSDAVRRSMADLGCDRLQGDVFGRPVPLLTLTG